MNIYKLNSLLVGKYVICMPTKAFVTYLREFIYNNAHTHFCCELWGILKYGKEICCWQKCKLCSFLSICSHTNKPNRFIRKSVGTFLAKEKWKIRVETCCYKMLRNSIKYFKLLCVAPSSWSNRIGLLVIFISSNSFLHIFFCMFSFNWDMSVQLYKFTNELRVVLTCRT